MSDRISPQLVLGLLVSGRGSNLQAILDAIRGGDLPARVGVVLSNKRGAPALSLAESALFVDPGEYANRSEYDAQLARLLQQHGVDLVVLAGYMRLVTSALISAYPNRMINIHPSLLPAFPGLHAQRQALSYGVKVSGCTVHFVDEAMDHGPIIAQATVPVLPGDTEERLSARILREEHLLLPRVIALYAAGRLKVEGRSVLISEPS